MFCTEEQRKDCRVEKMGCEGCFYENELQAIKILENQIKELKEDNYAYHQLMKMQNEREYRSKFLKDFQKEYGKNVMPDYDEIYKRYDQQKKQLANSILKSQIKQFMEEKIEELYEEIEECNMYDDDDNEEKRQLTDMIVLLKEISKELLEK